MLDTAKPLATSVLRITDSLIAGLGLRSPHPLNIQRPPLPGLLRRNCLLRRILPRTHRANRTLRLRRYLHPPPTALCGRIQLEDHDRRIPRVSALRVCTSRILKKICAANIQSYQPPQLLATYHQSRRVRSRKRERWDVHLPLPQLNA